MGWLFMHSVDGHSGPRQYLDAQFTFERDGGLRCRVLRSALVRMRTYYAAVERLRLGKPREVFALVCPVRYNPRDAEGDIFGYKHQSEAVGACAAECPLGILALLTPTDEPDAAAWRERCRAHAAQRASRPRLRPGQVVVFAEPVAFSDGRRCDRMTVVIDPRCPRAVRFRPPDGEGLYRISRLQDRAYRVLDA